MRFSHPVSTWSWNWILPALAVLAGVAAIIGLDLFEDPKSTPADIFSNLLEELPLVLITVGTVLLYRMARRHGAISRELSQDLATAKSQGEQWRRRSREYLDGLGRAIDAQFSQWKLSAAEREVALLLLKGLSTKEIATVRTTSERTAREQAQSIYGKSGLSGRAALSAYFLEDMLAAVDDADRGSPPPGA